MKKGDFVSATDEDLKGKITAVQNGFVEICDEHGFIHRVSKDKVVAHDGDFYNAMPIIAKPEPAKKISKKHGDNTFLLDLHFEKIGGKNQDSFERLFLQKQKLLDTLDFCRKHRLKKLQIIHGIGDGTLQKMVMDVLDSQTGLEYRHSEILHHQSGSILVDFR